MGTKARGAPGSGGTPATAQLSAAAIPFTEHHYTHDPRAASYGLEAAEALGVDPEVVFKTLLVQADASLGVVVVPVDRQVDLKAAAAALGAKRATMADSAAAQRSTGYVLGGISPFGQRRRLPTVLDESAWPTSASTSRVGAAASTSPWPSRTSSLSSTHRSRPSRGEAGQDSRRPAPYR